MYPPEQGVPGAVRAGGNPRELVSGAGRGRCSPAAPTEPPVIPRMGGGTLDRVGCERIEGWAWDRQKPDAPIAVEIYDGETLVVTATADRLRQDLIRGRKGNGRHGFVVNTPPSLRDGKTHEIHAKIADGGFELNKSPQELECPASQSTGTKP